MISQPMRDKPVATIDYPAHNKRFRIVRKHDQTYFIEEYRLDINQWLPALPNGPSTYSGYATYEAAFQAVQHWKVAADAKPAI